MVERDLRKLTLGVEKDLRKLLSREISQEKRVPLPSTTKNAVYKRAKGRCESCGRPLKISHKGAQFHHTRKPSVKSRPSTIQFLCAYCHTEYGHDYKTVTKRDILGHVEKTRKIVRKRVRRHKSPWWKEKPKKSLPRKKTTRKKKTKPKTTKTRRRRKKKR